MIAEFFKNQRHRNSLRIVLPVVLTIVLFVISINVIIIPEFEKQLMNQKKQMAREMVEMVTCILSGYNTRVLRGEISMAQAVKMASEYIRNCRYGKNEKDYFWIHDTTPKMVIHPFRPDLEGKDLSTYRDSTGKAVFMEMNAVATGKGGGFVSYLWQWKDDSDRIVPKVSYVKLFREWKWIVGTGVYIQDVHAEIAKTRTRVWYISAAIMMLIILLHELFIIQFIFLDRKRHQAEIKLNIIDRKYKDLTDLLPQTVFEADTSGIITYINVKGMEFFGYNAEDIEKGIRGLDLFVPEEHDVLWNNFQMVIKGHDLNRKRYTALTREGSRFPVLLDANLITYGDKKTGFRGIIMDISRLQNPLPGVDKG